MMNRVSIKKGRLPVLLVAPHAHPNDDINTDIIVDAISSELNTWSVINQGWRRAKRAVLGENIANLNDIRHCQLLPIWNEFLAPLIKIKQEIINKFGHCHIFYIHGMSNLIRHKTRDNVDIVLGYGAGNPPSYTCPLRYKNVLASRLVDENFVVYQGKNGGRFSACRKENLTQLFRKCYSDPNVQSIQMEIVNLRRYEPKIAAETAFSMARAIDKFLHSNSFPKDVELKEF